MQRSFRDFRRFMDETDLSPSQVGTLMWLYHNERCGVSDIGEHLGITTAASSQMVDRLVGQGLLERSEDPNDRRFKQVTLTPAGKSLVESGIEARQKWMERLTSNLTPEEQQMIVEALSLLAEAAQKLDLGEMQSE